MPSVSWVVHDSKIYFGSTNGKIYQADSGQNDNGASISVDCKQAFNYLGDETRLKLLQVVRPILTSEGSISLDLGADVDFEDTPTSQEIDISLNAGAEWDTGTWDVDDWASEEITSQDWYSVSGLGRAISVKVGGSFKNTTFSLSGWNVTYIPGGLI